MGAVASNGLVEPTLRRLKTQGFWCIAKLDVFVDHRLVYNNLYMGILDIRTGGTLDEGIMDRILGAREISFSRITGEYTKKLHLSELICRDLRIDPRGLRPKPIYIDWRNDCQFTRIIPQGRLSNYRIAGEAVFAKDRDIYAKFTSPKNPEPLNAEP